MRVDTRSTYGRFRGLSRERSGSCFARRKFGRILSGSYAFGDSAAFRVRRRRFLSLLFFLRDFLGVVLVHDAGHVGARLAKGRYALILLYPLRSGVVGGQCLDQIEIVALEQFP